MRQSLIVVILVGLIALGAGTTPAAAQTGQRCFPETGFCISGRLRQFWEQNGGLPVFGFPLGPQQEELIEGRPVQVQWFERNRLELHPENRAPYDVLLGRLGAEFVATQPAPGREEPQAGCVFFEQTGFNVCGEILGRWQASGLELDGRRGTSHAESLALFGLPQTGVYPMRLSDGREYQVQWFERARFELHPENPPPHSVLLGLLGREVLDARPKPVPLPEYWLERVNFYRSAAGVEPVSEDATLNENCAQHARYIAENNHLTHRQNPALPWASPAGQVCAEHGNVWIGYGGVWQPGDAIDSWMDSVGHRLWLLYPTTPTVGFGFYSAGSVAGAGIDILSRARLDADGSYRGWPVRYPAAGQISVPSGYYPITLQWPYFGEAPRLGRATLQTQAGVPIAIEATTDLPAGHKGIALLPREPLPDNTVFLVTVEGSYRGAAFTLSWPFSTGDAPLS